MTTSNNFHTRIVNKPNRKLTKRRCLHLARLAKRYIKTPKRTGTDMKNDRNGLEIYRNGLEIYRNGLEIDRNGL